MNNRKIYRLITKIVVIIVLILYVLFLTMDFYNVKILIASKYIKYLCILLCFLLSIISTKGLIMETEIYLVNRRDIQLLQVAMFITVISDLCLVIFNFYFLGVTLFSMVQITYGVRYSTKKTKETLVNFIIVFLFIILIYSIVSLFMVKVNVLVPISFFYFLCLLNSVIKAIKAFKNNVYNSPSKYMIVLGMLLFFLCDTCVAISGITVIFPLTNYFMSIVNQIANSLIWLFYLPSQLLLALSGGGKIE